jgi:hypothetical protein
MKITVTANHLINGDPMDPNDFDLIAQEGFLDVNLPIPGKDGWRVMTRSVHHNSVARVAYRYEIEGAAK